MEKKEFKTTIAGKELVVETGSLAQQAHGSVTVKYGETVVLATATMSDKRAEHLNFFPLMVDYEEKYYAGGKIKGSRFIKREGRPSDDAILTARLIDRTIRPLFDHRMRNEVQVIVTVFSYDQKNDPEVISVIAASLALAISDIPWNGPVAALKIGEKEGELEINPYSNHEEEPEMNFLAAGTEDKINMIEAEAKECPEEKAGKAFQTAQEHLKQIVLFEKDIIEKIGKERKKVELNEPGKDFLEKISAFLKDKGLADALYSPNKETMKSKMKEIEDAMNNMIEEEYPQEEVDQRKAEASFLFEEFLDAVLHRRVLDKEERPDGRKLDEIRKISCEVGLFPRTHGAGLFNRGETQALTVATLGSPGAEQLVETMEMEGKKRFMHHYNFPPYSVGEVKMMRGPGRREIGHGALAEKALTPVLPSKDEFPYTIRLVSEILSANGSSSMAATCGSTLALMDAGVPIKKPVAGIAMGIITEKGGTHKILSDIQGPEDHWGDMDFKVAGTKDGITAIQLDVKIEGITPAIIEEVLNKAKERRVEILGKMQEVIPEPRKELSEYAPAIINIKINPEKIREVIGPGGKVINEIIDETETEIDIEDDGNVYITAENKESAEKAKEWIKNLTREVVAGEVFEGKVTRIMNFGAFVEILPGQEGLVHISEIANERVNTVEDHLKTGQVIKVKVKEIDSQGRINLTMKNIK
ncbi:MAG: polyribonucleotide nucleotidyltransferase [Candidatus Moranbacteria bacterium]|nr:polyribonucleotide nucleotidyltransferase [Candidatus Moranbacteria bacterium]